MSRAFVKEDDTGGIEPLPDRPILPHPNIVPPHGLADYRRASR
jgi:transcription elongation factor GreB